MTSTHIHQCHTNRAAATTCLVERFERFLGSLADETLLEWVDAAAEDHLFQPLLAERVASPASLSVDVRNQLALTRGRDRAFEHIRASYELLEASTVTRILGITRQALSKRGARGKVMFYSHGGRKYYPGFQFEGNEVMAVIPRLIEQIGLDPDDTIGMNLLLGFLATPMDFSDPGEPVRHEPRYRLLNDAAALPIILRDFANRLAPGR